MSELDYKESWALKNWCFWTVVLERLLRVPWTARSSNQSILKEISHGISLGGMMLKLKLQYLGYLMRIVDSLEKSLMLGGIGGKRRRGRQRMRCLNASLTRWTWVWVNSGSWWWTGRLGMLQFMGLERVGHDWAMELNWLIGIIDSLCDTVVQNCKTDILQLELFKLISLYNWDILITWIKY